MGRLSDWPFVLFGDGVGEGGGGLLLLHLALVLQLLPSRPATENHVNLLGKLSRHCTNQDCLGTDPSLLPEDLPMFKIESCNKKLRASVLKRIRDLYGDPKEITHVHVQRQWQNKLCCTCTVLDGNKFNLVSDTDKTSSRWYTNPRHLFSKLLGLEHYVFSYKNPIIIYI